MSTWYKKIAIFLLVLSCTTFAQDNLTKSLTGLLNDAGKAYLGPIGSAFGSDLNSGWVHRAPVAKVFGIDIELGFVAMGTMFGDNAKTFNLTSDFRFNYDQAYEMVNKQYPSAPTAAKQQLSTEIAAQNFTTQVYGPTIVGKKTENVWVKFPGYSKTIGGTPYSIPAQEYKTPAIGVLDGVPALPLAAPQLTFGTIYGTSVAFRYLPSVKINDDLGEFKYFGFGLMHNPAMWIPVPLPVDLAASFFTQKMEIGKFFKATATTFGVFASKRFGWGALNLTPYAGFSVESSKLEVSYDAEFSAAPGLPSQKIPISFNLEGENSTRLTLGASIKLLFINLNADYNLAKYNSYSAGVSFLF